MTAGSWFQRFVRNSPGISGYFLLVLAVILNTIIMAIQGLNFFSSWNIGSVFSGNGPMIMACFAQMIALLVGGLDLSVGSNLALANTIIIVLTNQNGFSSIAAWGIALLCCTLVGMFNGGIIAFIRIPPILTTLSTMSIVGGLALFVLPRPGGRVPQEIYSRYGGFTLGIPTTVWVIIAMMLLWYLVQRYPIGKHLRAVGGNERSAFSCGIRTPLVKLFGYTLVGFYAGVAGILLTCLTATGDPRIGLPFTLNSIAGVVLGGTMFASGWGSIGGTLAGALFLALVNNIVFFAFSSIVSAVPSLVPSPYMQNLLSSTIIVLALASTTITYKRQEAAQKKQAMEQQHVVEVPAGEDS
jgi:ribose transport system permease protein